MGNTADFNPLTSYSSPAPLPYRWGSSVMGTRLDWHQKFPVRFWAAPPMFNIVLSPIYEGSQTYKIL